MKEREEGEKGGCGSENREEEPAPGFVAQLGLGRKWRRPLNQACHTAYLSTTTALLWVHLISPNIEAL